jgi:hypothetical protein
MQQTLRPYATAGVALVGASIIAVTPVAAPLPEIQARSVKLVDAWSDLLTETTANLTNINANADPTAIAGVFSALVTNPLGVIQALTNLDPTVTGSVATGLTVELPPGLELALGQLGAEGATLNAINDVVAQLATNPSGALNTLFEAPATIANAFLNGQDNISLLNGIINIAGFNGILAPTQDVSINLNLPDLLNALGLGNLSLSSLNLSDLLSQLGLGNLSLGALFQDLNLDGLGLGDLLSQGSGITSLGGLLDLLGLDTLGAGQGITLALTDILHGLKLDTGVDLDHLTVSSVLSAFGIDPTHLLSSDSLLGALGLDATNPVSMTSLLSELGLHSANPVSLEALLGAAGLGSTTVTPDDLLAALSITGLGNDVTSGTLLSALGLTSSSPISLDALLDAAGVGSTSLTPADVLSVLGLDTGNPVSPDILLGAIGLNLNAPIPGLSLASALTGVLHAFGVNVTLPVQTALNSLLSLVGSGTAPTLGGLLSSLGIAPTDANLGSLLGDLGLNPASLTVGHLLSELGLTSNGLSLGGLLDAFGVPPDGLTLGDLLSNLGVSGDNLTVGDLLSELGLSSNGLTIGTLLDDLGLTDNLTVGGLLSDLGLSGDGLSLGALLDDLGIVPGDDLTIGGILGDLGFAPDTGDLTLGGLLTDLGNPFGALDITGLLNGLNVGDLLTDLGLSDQLLTGLPGVLDLGDLSNLTLDGLLSDLNLGDIGLINIDGFGGLVTELVDVIPGQIIAALGG